MPTTTVDGENLQHVEGSLEGGGGLQGGQENPELLKPGARIQQLD